jgi:hypothetical protein
MTKQDNKRHITGFFPFFTKCTTQTMTMLLMTMSEITRDYGNFNLPNNIY